MSNLLQPHRLQNARLLCLPLFPRVCSNSCPLSWWCYLTISFSAAPFSFGLWSFPALPLIFSNVLPNIKLRMIGFVAFEQFWNTFISLHFYFYCSISRISWVQRQETRLLVKEPVPLCFIIMVISGSWFVHL